MEGRGEERRGEERRGEERRGEERRGEERRGEDIIWLTISFRPLRFQTEQKPQVKKKSNVNLNNK